MSTESVRPDMTIEEIRLALAAQMEEAAAATDELIRLSRALSRATRRLEGARRAIACWQDQERRSAAMLPGVSR